MEHVARGRREHREFEPVRAIGVEEIHTGKAHTFLTLVYQIEANCVRLLWVGQERTMRSFEQVLTLIGSELAGRIKFACSDMWRPYLDVIARHCP